MVNNNGSGAYLILDTNTHLLVARVNYAPGGDTMTAWMDPNTWQDENNQNSATTYTGTLSGDLSFNRFFLRGGNSNKQFDYGEIHFGTSWSSVLPAITPVTPPPPVFGSVTALPGNQVSLSFSGPAGQSYSVFATTNLALPLADWTAVSTGTFGFNPVTFEDATATNFAQRFYIIAVP